MIRRWNFGNNLPAVTGLRTYIPPPFSSNESIFVFSVLSFISSSLSIAALLPRSGFAYS
jgi:hypothetical protein